MAAQNQLIEWINSAGMAEGGKKADLVRKITEVLINQAPEMIPDYLENVLSFANNKSTDVKKQVIAFIEELSKSAPRHLPEAVGHLMTFLNDSVIAVQKRAIQASSIVHRHMLQWIGKSSAPVVDKQLVWDQMNKIKIHILNMIDSDNEGIRTHSIKFLEEIILLQTPRDGAVAEEGDYSVEDIDAPLPFIHKPALEQESEHIFNLLLKFNNSEHISSVNLMSCMASLCSLAKYRPRYMARVVQALVELHEMLPPTLTQSQVNSVKKHLKMLLIIVAKHPSSTDHLSTLAQLLLDLGLSNQEINKIIPKERRQKRQGEAAKFEIPSKRPRVEPYIPEPVTSTTPGPGPEPVQLPEPVQIAISEDSLYEGLNKLENVVALVTSTLLHKIPSTMPGSFPYVYKPVPNPGTPAQKRQLARMMYSLIKGEPIVSEPVTTTQPSLSAIVAKIPKASDDKVNLRNAVAKLQESTKADKQIEDAVMKLREETRQDFLKEEERKAKQKEKPIPLQTPTVPTLKHRVKLLKLQEITMPIPKEIKQRLVIQAVKRILNAEHDAVIGGAAAVRTKLVTIFASSYTPELRELVLAHILEDAETRTELAITWLYEEYAFMQGFNRHPVTLQPKVHEKHDQNYNQLLCALITQICERGDPNTESCKDVLLRKIYLEAPHITEEAIDYLKYLVTDEKMSVLALELLEEICIMRPPKAHKYVTALLTHVLNESEFIRSTAIKSAVKIYKVSPESVKRVIEKYAKVYLGFIAMSTPPVDLFMGDTRIRHKWTDDLYRLCINLIMALFPENEDLILEVGRVYGQARAEAKRCVLRAVETPVRGAGGAQPAMLRLLDECPRGAETLLTRLVHLLTEKTPPTPELVSRVRELYATRVSDVRFLIPVLNGLTKKEVLAALPKLIKLNPVVVKEVFNKLLGLHNIEEENLPLAPAELLVALHLIEPSTTELKFAIKATALCFAEKQTYTQEVVAEVLEQLMELPEIPVLMMRSVLQALTLYPALAGLVLNLLSRLIEKEVWSNKVAWEGWMKCCERLCPTSCAVMMRLPLAPLRACVSSSPMLGAALRAHVAALPPAQQAALPEDLTSALATPPPQQQPIQTLEITPPYVPPLGINPLEPLPPGMD